MTKRKGCIGIWIGLFYPLAIRKGDRWIGRSTSAAGAFNSRSKTTLETNSKLRSPPGPVFPLLRDRRTALLLRAAYGCIREKRDSLAEFQRACPRPRRLIA